MVSGLKLHRNWFGRHDLRHMNSWAIQMINGKRVSKRKLEQMQRIHSGLHSPNEPLMKYLWFSRSEPSKNQVLTAVDERGEYVLDVESIINEEVKETLHKLRSTLISHFAIPESYTPLLAIIITPPDCHPQRPHIDSFDAFMSVIVPFSDGFEHTSFCVYQYRDIKNHCKEEVRAVLPTSWDLLPQIRFPKVNAGDCIAFHPDRIHFGPGNPGDSPRAVFYAVWARDQSAQEYLKEKGQGVIFEEARDERTEMGYKLALDSLDCPCEGCRVVKYVQD